MDIEADGHLLNSLERAEGQKHLKDDHAMHDVVT